MNKLLLGDNLDILKTLPSESIDLIYLDPFVLSQDADLDYRPWDGIEHYIIWLKERVLEMYRILKSTGSIFLHCEWRTSAYIRVFILDKLFGEQNFRGEIIWQRCKNSNNNRELAILKDTIWYYSKSEKIVYHPMFSVYNKNYLDGYYKYKDEHGYFSLGDLGNPCRVNKNGLYEYKGYKPPRKGWRCSITTMRKWEENGLIYFPKNKNQRLRFKRYVDDTKGNLCGDVWTDIKNIQPGDEEYLDYPGQKPEMLLERIIQMASNENDIILDSFVGSGTTVVVADRLKRRWIGIDQSIQAIKISQFRLQKQHSLFSTSFF